MTTVVTCRVALAPGLSWPFMLAIRISFRLKHTPPAWTAAPLPLPPLLDRWPQLLSLNLETGQPASPPAGHWDVVVASLQLTPQQAADIAAVYELYRGLIAKAGSARARGVLWGLGAARGSAGLVGWALQGWRAGR